MKKIAVDGEKMALVLWILLLLAIVILNGMVGDWGRLAGGPDNLVRFFFQSLWPPDMSVLEPNHTLFVPPNQFSISLVQLLGRG